MKTLLPAAMIFCGLFTAVNSALAQTWTTNSLPDGNGQAFASSADGSKLYFSTSGGFYASTNSGITWERLLNISFGVSSVALSADGNELLLCNGAYKFYTSTNGGVTWITNSVSLENNASAASSADGSKLFVLTISGGLYASTNSGIGWYFVNSRYGNTLACSADGTKLVAGLNNGGIYSSTNSGVTWETNNLPNTNWFRVTSTADGNKLLAEASYEDFVSTNSGSAWTQITNDSNLFVVGWTEDGTKLVAFSFTNGVVYTSVDLGATWTATGNATNSNLLNGFSFAALSADGSKLFVSAALGSPNYVYTWQSTPSPQLNLTASSNSLAFSWLIPSTNFVLQQNLDLTTTNWVALTNQPTLNLTNLNDEVVLPQTNSSSFFRLIAQ